MSSEFKFKTGYKLGNVIVEAVWLSCGEIKISQLDNAEQIVEMRVEKVDESIFAICDLTQTTEYLAGSLAYQNTEITLWHILGYSSDELDLVFNTKTELDKLAIDRFRNECKQYELSTKPISSKISEHKLKYDTMTDIELDLYEQEMYKEINRFECLKDAYESCRAILNDFFDYGKTDQLEKWMIIAHYDCLTHKSFMFLVDVEIVGDDNMINEPLYQYYLKHKNN